VVGGEGVDQAGDEGQAELSNGVATSVVAGEGAINPAELPPMVWCGWEGASADTMSLLRSHDAEYPGLSWSLSRICSNPSISEGQNFDLAKYIVSSTRYEYSIQYIVSYNTIHCF
jgi:hypothetical protein